MSQITLITIGMFVSILLSLAASRIYDLLKDQGFFSDRSIVKNFLTVGLFVAPVIVLTFFSEVYQRGSFSIEDFINAPVRLWQMLLMLMAALGVGYYLGNQPLDLFSGRTVLRKLAFDFADSPAKHGWRVDGKPRFKRVTDPVMGKGVKLSGSEYRMDYRLDSRAKEGDVVEFMGDFGNGGLLYIGAAIQGANSNSTANLWLQVRPGDEAPKEIRNKREGWHQWMIYIQPISQKNSWGLYRINLKDAVRDTVGAAGWSLKELEYIRVRGELSINHIAILS